MSFVNVDRIEGDGFTLRPLAEAHVDMVVAASRTDIPDWTYVPRDLDDVDALAWIRRRIDARREGRGVGLAIEVAGATAAAGVVGGLYNNPRDLGVIEMFYFVLPSFRRRGLASRVLRRVTDWLRDSDDELRRLELHAIVGNPGSAGVAESAGYQREGVRVNLIPPINGYGPRDAIGYGLAIGPAHGGRAE